MGRFILQEQKDMFDVIDSETGKLIKHYLKTGFDLKKMEETVAGMNSDVKGTLSSLVYRKMMRPNITQEEKDSLSAELSNIMAVKNG